MEFGILISLFVVTFLNAAVPGPGVILVASIAASFGAAGATRVVLGILAGTAFLLSISFAITLGILSFSNFAYDIMQFFGVFVLAYLAWVLWPRSDILNPRPQELRFGFFWTGAALALSQPLSLVFLLAIVPQFGSGESMEYQAILGLSAVVLFATSLAMAAAALCGNSLSKYLRKFQKTFLRIVALSLVVFSGLSAVAAFG